MCAGARATGSRARSGLRGDRDAVSLRGKTPRADPLARRDFPPLHVAPAGPSSSAPNMIPFRAFSMVCREEKFPCNSQAAPNGSTMTGSAHSRRGRRFRLFVKRFIFVLASAASNPDCPHKKVGNSGATRLCHSCGSSTGVAHGQPRARVPHLVGSSLPGPYHFRARIQSFQAFAAPFPGDSRFAVRSSGAAIPTTETPRFKNRRSARRSPPGRRCRNHPLPAASRGIQPSKTKGMNRDFAIGTHDEPS